MQFIEDKEGSRSEAALSERLRSQLLLGKRVAWILTGGSNIPVATRIMQTLHNIPNLEHLTIMLGDERFGKVNHPDSNWFQLEQGGFLCGAAVAIPPFTAETTTLEQAVTRYEQVVKKVFESHDEVIVQMGMGPDGHILGILPHSPATEPSDALVVGYVGPDFQRLTMTAKAAARFSVVYLLAYGPAKQEKLQELAEHDLPIAEQPAQLLKHLREVYIYNDQIGEA